MSPSPRILTAFVRAHLALFVITAAAGLIMAGLGAFNTDSVPFGDRLAYWCVVMPVGGLMGALATEFLQRRRWLADRPWLRVAAAALLMTPPQTLAVWTASRVFFNPRWDPTLLVVLLPSVLLVSAVVMVIDHLARSRAAPLPEPVPGSPAPPAAPRFLERLPPKLRGAELYAVEAVDHYLRLHTSRGSDLILMRFSDALIELEGVDGARTHRSWWVARAGVTAGGGVGRRAVLTLKSGVEAPVSRANVPALRQAGWF